jgi:MinD superfamily P-loop ATPase
VIGVVGGSGGVGASTFAAVLAATATAGGLRDAVLVDLDPVAGGIDVLLGAEDLPGPRWSGLRLAGGDLEPRLLAEGLPRWSSVAFIAADVMPTAAVVQQAVGIASAIGPVVIDLARWPCDARRAAIDGCDLVVLVARPEVAALTAARAVSASLGDVRVGAVIRIRSTSGRADRIARLLGVPLIGTMAPRNRVSDAPIDASALPHGVVRIARGVLDAALTSRRAAA